MTLASQARVIGSKGAVSLAGGISMFGDHLVASQLKVPATLSAFLETLHSTYGLASEFLMLGRSKVVESLLLTY